MTGEGCGCFPHGPDEACTCRGCWACAGRVVGCTCDIAWDCEHETTPARRRGGGVKANLDTPGMKVTLGPGHLTDGEWVVNVTVKASRFFTLRLWLAVRVIKLATLIAPPLARRVIADRVSGVKARSGEVAA